MARVDYIENTVTVDGENRCIRFLSAEHQRVTVEFSEKARADFTFACAVAIAQELRAPDARPTPWLGVDDAFLISVVAPLYPSGKVTVRSLHEYWRGLRVGEPKSHGMVIRIERDGEISATRQQDQRTLAGQLFQERGSHMFLGSREGQPGEYVFWHIEFRDKPPQLKEHVEEYYRSRAQPGLGPSGEASERTGQPAGPQQEHKTAVRAGVDAREQHLRSYLEGVRNHLNRLDLYSTTRAGDRDEQSGGLYMSRILISAADETASLWQSHRESAPQEGADRDHPRERLESEQLDELRALDSSPRICVIGEAGSGKSTFLEQLGWTLANDSLDGKRGETGRVPFLIELRCWRAGQHASLEGLICSQAPRLSKPLVRHLCQSGRAVLLLNGLDEVSDRGGRRTAFMKWLERQVSHASASRCAVVLAGRPWAFDWLRLRHFRTQPWVLKPLSNGDIETYIGRYYPYDRDRARRLVERLQRTPALREVVRRPLLLMLLCFLCEEGEGLLPFSEGELLERATRELLRRRGFSGEVSLHLLGRMAWACWTQRKRHLTERELLGLIVRSLRSDGIVRLSARGRRPDAILGKLVQRSGIIREDGGTYRFAEETYVEYLAGRWLAGTATR